MIAQDQGKEGIASPNKPKLANPRPKERPPLIARLFQVLIGDSSGTRSFHI